MNFAYLFGYKCKACCKRFKLRKENKYLVQAEQGPFGKLAGPAAVYDAYDCPVCGGQNRVNVRYPEYVPDVYVLDDKDEEQDGEPEGWSVEVIPDTGKGENYFRLHLDPEIEIVKDENTPVDMKGAKTVSGWGEVEYINPLLLDPENNDVPCNPESEGGD